MTPIAGHILEELTYSDLTTHDLARRLKVTITDLKTELRQLEISSMIKLISIRTTEDKVWRLV